MLMERESSRATPIHSSALPHSPRDSGLSGHTRSLPGPFPRLRLGPSFSEISAGGSQRHRVSDRTETMQRALMITIKTIRKAAEQFLATL